jgi:hypothetical protein
MWNWSQSGRYTTNTTTTTRNSCVCVWGEGRTLEVGQRKGKQLGKRLKKTTPHAGDGGLCVFTQLVGPQDGCKWTDCLPARPPAQVVPTVQPPVWWSPYSSVGHELRRKFLKPHAFSHFEFFFGSQLTKFGQGKHLDK